MSRHGPGHTRDSDSGFERRVCLGPERGRVPGLRASTRPFSRDQGLLQVIDVVAVAGPLPMNANVVLPLLPPAGARQRRDPFGEPAVIGRSVGFGPRRHPGHVRTDPFRRPGQHGAVRGDLRRQRGVHTNSGIPNRAMYLMAHDLGEGVAAKIVYLAETQFLTPTSTFADAYTAMSNAAASLDGPQSANFQQTLRVPKSTSILVTASVAMIFGS